MPKPRNRFADLPPITDFESCQRVRPMLLHRVGDAFEVWRSCEDKSCRRAKSCRRGDGTCLFAFMAAQPDAARRLLFYTVKNRIAGLSPDEAWAQAQARVADEIARYGG
ncbi:hypothetical protein [Bosea vaviloviae]|uniref:Uncharacterized protein n=1 Tax=Bosea vaviloviae TaxID=1526658 RepID=A0A0N1N3Y0_9HYPH|nr:hypothetical protein [Bosea vaviloviae]KPH81156.1 hypothetical protein AE618_08855 [Bosea vaviloviae]